MVTPVHITDFMVSVSANKTLFDQTKPAPNILCEHQLHQNMLAHSRPVWKMKDSKSSNKTNYAEVLVHFKLYTLL